MGADGLPPETRMGMVTLRVNDLDEQVEFYRRVVGVPTVDREGDRATLRAGETALVELVEAPEATERPRTAAGLFHLAIRVPDRGALADALARVRSEWRLAGASDHDASEALYLSDPEGNGIEIYRDRPREEWTYDEDGRVVMTTEPLAFDALDDGDADTALPAETDLGHVHLETSALAPSRAFYVDDLGFEVSGAFDDGAAFLSAGGYHHHLAINTWNGRSTPVGDHRGLTAFEVVVPDADALAAVGERFETRGVDVERDDGAVRVEAPDGITVRVRAEE
ncbi:catechol 2,3-dioxygenase [Natronoarchaeum philippinense]|uniref:Catechol 2,3-dioxygenase n=1 Tax=Natronoarchaeum philippinense TaxID=558529 RepID=A0A285NSK4_NATPI|nr:VOC family protein [Natronoarchaeum philippinense]SNZ12490.1 catechol 2,3-dioxygenase [Natronoarchaeum philippinense]